MTVLSVLAAETLFELTFQRAPEDSDHEGLHHYENDRLLNQRNFVVSTVSLFLMFVLRQLVELTRDNMKMQFNTEALKKQASNVSSEYMRLLDEKSPDSKDKGNNKVEPAKKLQQENSDLVQQLEKAKKDLAKALQEVATIKKQAENQQESFIKLAEENKSLSNKLNDFNLVFGESQKKAV